MEARKLGVQTLIDKLLNIFSVEEVNNPNLVLWIKEKTKFITFLAGKLTDIYSDNKPQQIKQDQNITIKFESGFDKNDTIELSPEDFEFTPPEDEVKPKEETD